MTGATEADTTPNMIIPGDGTPDPGTASRVVNRLRDLRVLISLTGKHQHVLKIRPPLVVREGEIDRFLVALRQALGSD
jgi:4-aminobutyrate aminotransferase-like enzyme